MMKYDCFMERNHNEKNNVIRMMVNWDIEDYTMTFDLFERKMKDKIEMLDHVFDVHRLCSHLCLWIYRIVSFRNEIDDIVLENLHRPLFDIDLERRIRLNARKILYNHLREGKFRDNVIVDSFFRESFDLLHENISIWNEFHRFRSIRFKF